MNMLGGKEHSLEVIQSALELGNEQHDDDCEEDKEVPWTHKGTTIDLGEINKV